VRLADAEKLLELSHQLDHETNFMMLEPGERRTTLAEQQARIRNILERDNCTLLVAEDKGKLIGFLSATGGEYQRIRHRAYLVIGILQAYTGQGIGARLFEALDSWAKEHGIHRLELTVMTHNTAAIALYKKMGFDVEGTKRQSMQIDGQYVDELFMGKLME
jgi:RimJ/RimL family protein N-acetyltransferase